jgi:hypothetical protein
MYNELVDQHDLYCSFVHSDEWKSQVKTIREISPEAANAIQEYGIGTKVTDDGQYHFESGQLLEDIPKAIRDSHAIEEAYDAICDLAKAYARFVCSYGSK